MSSTIRTAVISLAAAILIVGCGPGDNPEQAAIESARVAAANQYQQVTSESQKLSHLSTEQDLMSSKAKVQEVMGKLRALSQIGEPERAQINSLESEIKRLDAALVLHKAKAAWDTLMADARFSSRDAKRPIPEKRALLRDQWQEFRQADDDLMAAERAYTDAQNRLAADMQRAKGGSLSPRT